MTPDKLAVFVAACNSSPLKQFSSVLLHAAQHGVDFSTMPTPAFSQGLWTWELGPSLRLELSGEWWAINTELAAGTAPPEPVAPTPIAYVGDQLLDQAGDELAESVYVCPDCAFRKVGGLDPWEHDGSCPQYEPRDLEPAAGA